MMPPSQPLPRRRRLAILLLPAAALCLAPWMFYFLYQPSAMPMAIASATAVLGLLIYPCVLLLCRDLTRPLKRSVTDLRYRWISRQIDRKRGRQAYRKHRN